MLPSVCRRVAVTVPSGRSNRLLVSVSDENGKRPVERRLGECVLSRYESDSGLAGVGSSILSLNFC